MNDRQEKIYKILNKRGSASVDTLKREVFASEATIRRDLKQMEQDPKMQGKPEKVLEGIIMGKLGKFYDNNCLVEQAYVKEDNMKVSAYVAKTAKELGGDIKVVAFYRYDKGEGLQKREDNFGDEIASMLGKA